MIDLLIGAFALVLILVLLHGFARADPKSLVKGLRYLGAGALVLAAAFFLVRGIVPAAVLLGSMAYGVFTGGRVWPGSWPHWHFPHPGGGARAQTQTGQTTQVATEWLDMKLDHDTGEMRGRVLKGAFAGRPLTQLSDEDVVSLHAEAGAADSDTARLLEAYLDRRLGPDWRTKTDRRTSSSEWRGSSSVMTSDEAYRVLGLLPGASEDDVLDAYKRLMMSLHPDRGGTDYLASKINEAKDVLLR
jgi:hypothetical protein